LAAEAAEPQLEIRMGGVLAAAVERELYAHHLVPLMGVVNL